MIKLDLYIYRFLQQNVYFPAGIKMLGSGAVMAMTHIQSPGEDVIDPPQFINSWFFCTQHQGSNRTLHTQTHVCYLTHTEVVCHQFPIITQQER